MLRKQAAARLPSARKFTPNSCWVLFWNDMPTVVCLTQIAVAVARSCTVPRGHGDRLPRGTADTGSASPRARARTSWSEQNPARLAFRHSRPRSRPSALVTAARRRPVAVIARCASARLAPGGTVRPASRPSGAAAASRAWHPATSSRSTTASRYPAGLIISAAWTWSSRKNSRISPTVADRGCLAGAVTMASATVRTTSSRAVYSKPG
jgi:hypothetical protein